MAAHKFPTEVWPKYKSQAATLLYAAAENLRQVFRSYTDVKRFGVRDYNDQKAAQLLEAKADLLIAELKIEAWFMDLGFQGCSDQGCNNEIGGIPCIEAEDTL